MIDMVYSVAKRDGSLAWWFIDEGSRRRLRSQTISRPRLGTLMLRFALQSLIHVVLQIYMPRRIGLDEMATEVECLVNVIVPLLSKQRSLLSGCPTIAFNAS
jgi:hypothetical protein